MSLQKKNYQIARVFNPYKIICRSFQNRRSYIFCNLFPKLVGVFYLVVYKRKIRVELYNFVASLYTQLMGTAKTKALQVSKFKNPLQLLVRKIAHLLLTYMTYNPFEIKYKQKSLCV